LANANSYISIADADTYHEARGNTAWSDVGDEDKEAALLKATAYLQGVYAGQWKGYPTTALQALDWPRAYVERLEYAALTSSSLWLESDVIPAGLSQACAELGLRALSADLSPDLGANHDRRTARAARRALRTGRAGAEGLPSGGRAVVALPQRACQRHGPVGAHVMVGAFLFGAILGFTIACLVWPGDED
jgi:hypothetical protein